MIELPKPALFLAGKAFLRYRRQGGTKSNVLGDFYIGAHASVARYAILTRDTRYAIRGAIEPISPAWNCYRPTALRDASVSIQPMTTGSTITFNPLHVVADICRMF